MNREHAKENGGADRALTDAQLDGAAAMTLNSDAPRTCQFRLEDHAARHSYYWLESERPSPLAGSSNSGDLRSPIPALHHTHLVFIAQHAHRSR